jgi:anti-anti-sigma factor
VFSFEEKLSSFVRDDTRDVIIDLINISKIDSMSIAAIIRIKNKLADQGRNLKLINPSEGVMRVLELAGLESFLLD